MTEGVSIRIALKSQIAECPMGHRIGETWTTSGASPERICLGALNMLSPAILTLRCGGDFPWTDQAGVGYESCFPGKRCSALDKIWKTGIL